MGRLIIVMRLHVRFPLISRPSSTVPNRTCLCLSPGIIYLSNLPSRQLNINSASLVRLLVDRNLVGDSFTDLLEIADLGAALKVGR
jgi:hypothetical protein